MKRSYNRRTYGALKNISGIFRDRCAPDPTSALKVFGIIGKILAWIIDKLLVKPIHILSFLLAGLFYDKKKDSPYKGMLLYSLMFFAITSFISQFFKIIINH